MAQVKHKCMFMAKLIHIFEFQGLGGLLGLLKGLLLLKKLGLIPLLPILLPVLLPLLLFKAALLLLPLLLLLLIPIPVITSKYLRIQISNQLKFPICVQKARVRVSCE